MSLSGHWMSKFPTKYQHDKSPSSWDVAASLSTQDWQEVIPRKVCLVYLYQMCLPTPPTQPLFLKKKNLLEDSCFTKLCWFLPDINMNQRQVHTHPLPLNLPPTAHRTPPPRLSQSTGLSSLHHTANPTSCLSYIRWCKCFYAALSIRPTLSLPSTVSTNLFSVSASPLPPCI